MTVVVGFSQPISLASMDKNSWMKEVDSGTIIYYYNYSMMIFNWT